MNPWNMLKALKLNFRVSVLHLVTLTAKGKRKGQGEHANSTQKWVKLSLPGNSANNCTPLSVHAARLALLSIAISHTLLQVTSNVLCLSVCLCLCVCECHSGPIKDYQKNSSINTTGRGLAQFVLIKWHWVGSRKCPWQGEHPSKWSTRTHAGGAARHSRTQPPVCPPSIHWSGWRVRRAQRLLTSRALTLPKDYRMSHDS